MVMFCVQWSLTLIGKGGKGGWKRLSRMIMGSEGSLCEEGGYNLSIRLFVAITIATRLMCLQLNLTFLCRFQTVIVIW